MSSDLLTQTVVNVFRHYPAAVQKINFMLGGLKISPEGYGEIAQMIESGDLPVIPLQRSSKDVVAHYDPQKNTLALRGFQIADHGARSWVIHECTHALVDSQCVMASQVEHECAAFIAQAMFLLSVAPAEVAASTNKLIQSAALIVLNRKMLQASGQKLKRADYDSLARVVRDVYRNAYDPATIEQKAWTDGINRSTWFGFGQENTCKGARPAR